MPTTHKVKQGECIASIASQFGFFPGTIWDDAENSTLKKDRQDPNVLQPDDEVFIPDKRGRSESLATEERHRFLRKGVPEKFRLRLTLYGKPRAKLAYTLIVDGLHKPGETDNDGMIDEFIPPESKTGKLIVNDDEEYAIQFGGLDPVDSKSGGTERLINLGFLDRDDTEDSAAMIDALREFQFKYGIEVSGNLDDATAQKLVETHGS